MRRRTCGRAATLLRDSRLGAAAGAKPSTQTRAAKARRTAWTGGHAAQRPMLNIEGVGERLCAAQRSRRRARLTLHRCFSLEEKSGLREMVGGKEKAKQAKHPKRQPFRIRCSGQFIPLKRALLGKLPTGNGWGSITGRFPKQLTMG